MDTVQSPDPRNYQSHYDGSIFARYHTEIYMPENVRRGLFDFLPPPGAQLKLSKHYQETAAKRHLPLLLRIAGNYEIIDATVVRDTWAIYRVLIRMPWFWSKGRRAIHDLCLVLEGDYEVVTAYWIRREDQHETLDASVYEQPPMEVK